MSRVVFFGTPAVAVVGLESLLSSDHSVAAVVTQPDRPRGRSRELVPSPVKDRAVSAGIPVLQPPTPKDESFAQQLASFGPEVLAVIAYGHILPRTILAIAPAVNVHFSLLPRYRGAAPVQRALMDGARETGVSVFLLEPTIDTGPVLFTERTAIAPQETAGELLERLAPIGGRLLVRALDAIATGSTTPQIQDDAQASPAPKITSEETRVDWTRPATEVVNRIRGLSPRPGAWTRFGGRRVTLLRARTVVASGRPGTVIDTSPLVIACGEGGAELIEVQPEGKTRMSAADFVRGYRPAAGDVFDEGDR